MRRVRFFVSGSVQGVCYRYYAARKARELGLKGFIRNIPNGKVEVLVEGEEEKVKEFMAFCKNNPGYSRVKSLDIIEEKESAGSDFDSFEIRY